MLNMSTRLHGLLFTVTIYASVVWLFNVQINKKVAIYRR